ncbi:hypothetical protein SAMN02745121_08073 [Nannocystis exedens]|uniref:Uncharacterized protein n=1 Tax=Nannocystis exedens TaxID=54 RepID=A0A1I2HL92_9BACT|nr:hypothetical protein NAEX_02374 [Nannocystis exedens]SFF31085.1 hypothetical protein SAMN02745121_08073 [Nannocystis exedens]
MSGGFCPGKGPDQFFKMRLLLQCHCICVTVERGETPPRGELPLSEDPSPEMRAEPAPVSA